MIHSLLLPSVFTVCACVYRVCVHHVCCLRSFISVGSHLRTWDLSWVDEEASACASASVRVSGSGRGGGVVKEHWWKKAGCGCRGVELEG